jgi:hypothetical protein
MQRAGVMRDTSVRSRPIGITILAGAAAVALVLAGVHFLQALGLLPYFIGPIAVRSFDIWYSLMWLLMIWVWAWVVRALWAVDPQAWLFLVIVSGFNLMIDFTTMLFTTPRTTDLAVSFVVNALIFAYALMPGTKRAFDVG